ncbi:MAG: branched-chain amino acid ABC transporter permease [Thermodesulfobacteriota bacterium]
MLAQLVVSGLAIGACYALIALAMVIVYKTSEVLNFAQGEMAMLATFVAFSILTEHQVGFPAAFLLTMLFALILGVVLELAFLRPAKNPTVLGLIVITLGLEMILYGLAGWRWGPEQQGLPFPVSNIEVYKFGQVAVSKISIWVFLMAMTIMVLLFLFFRYTRLGVAMKATQQNRLAARIMGIRTKRILSFTWALSSLVGTVAGVLIASSYPLDVNMMMDPMMKAFAGAVMGGMTSLPGAVIGAELMGIIENLFGGYVSLEFKSVVAFAIIVLVLCVRPSGLLARHFVKKV